MATQRREGKKREKPAHLVARAKNKFTTYQVKEACELLDFLMKAKDGISRNAAKSVLANRMVYVNNVNTTLYNYPLKPGMKVQISKTKGQREFSSKFFSILYEDAYLILIDKKEGIATVSPENKPKELSVLTILNDYLQRTSKQSRAFLIHRLDKEASGLVVFAKDEKTKFTFQDHWDEIVKERKFVAIVTGDMENERGIVTSWLRDGKIYFSTVASGIGNSVDKAVTHYHTIKRSNGYSLIELEPETGKKDQIRLHMRELGHPLLGDAKHGVETEGEPMGRLALHAFKLNFFHPVTGEAMKFETAYPGTFKNIMLKK